MYISYYVFYTYYYNVYGIYIYNYYIYNLSYFNAYTIYSIWIQLQREYWGIIQGYFGDGVASQQVVDHLGHCKVIQVRSNTRPGKQTKSDRKWP